MLLRRILTREKIAARGDDDAGAAVVRAWLESKGIATRGVAIHDGSGLSRLDLVTPEATATAACGDDQQQRAATVFHDSLPIAGRDGTLGSRLKSHDRSHLCQDRHFDLHALTFRVCDHATGRHPGFFNHV